MTAFSGKAFQSAMVQGRTLGTFSSSWFWKLEFGKCCTAVMGLSVRRFQTSEVNVDQFVGNLVNIYDGQSGRFSSGLKTGPSETGLAVNILLTLDGFQYCQDRIMLHISGQTLPSQCPLLCRGPTCSRLTQPMV